MINELEKNGHNPMGILHSVVKFQDGGLRGIQACQRDWSKYLVHFTSATAMESLKQYPCKKKYTPVTVAKKLAAADKKSLKIVKKIKKTMSLHPSSPSSKDDVKQCVCFSECNLPGLIDHSERYGRFGFVFSKEKIFALGGRPTIYVDRTIYEMIAQQYRKSDPNNIFSLANVYSPPGTGEVQDFTHEREWRLFQELPFLDNLVAVLCPLEYYEYMYSSFEVPTIPIDFLNEWGL